MTYKVYINKDYKPVVRDTVESSVSKIRRAGFVGSGCLLVIIILISVIHKNEVAFTEDPSLPVTLPELSALNQNITNPIDPVLESTANEDSEIYETNIDEPVHPTKQDATLSSNVSVEAVIPDNWESLKVTSGDNLSLIFGRMNISAQVLNEIMSLGKDVEILKRLMPDHEMRFQIENGELEALQYDMNITDTLHISKHGNLYKAETVKSELETRVKTSYGSISDSLFLSAQRAGLSDNLIMQMVDIYGWDIDFALDIREGDRFYVIYEEKYKDGVKVQEGPILAAEFINQNKPFRALRYTHADGYSDYYNEEGYSMRKAFLRTPVKFSRISSGFSLGRKHPILNTIRAHRGVDYAAPTGTPVKATGDGIVDFAGNKGGYGRVIVLRHGDKYSTLYGHLSRFASSLKTGKRVKQGQIIGYVGMTGLATGPHLHYEFRINGIHHNPLTVALPKVIGITSEIMADFKQQTSPLLAQLNSLTGSNQARAEKKDSTIALYHSDEAVKPD